MRNYSITQTDLDRGYCEWTHDTCGEQTRYGVMSVQEKVAAGQDPDGKLWCQNCHTWDEESNFTGG